MSSKEVVGYEELPDGRRVPIYRDRIDSGGDSDHLEDEDDGDGDGDGD